MSMITIGLLGNGIVGQGVQNIIHHNQTLLKNRIGSDVNVSHVLVRDPSKYEETPGVVLTTDPDQVLNNPDIQVIIEVMGGETPAFDYICRALKNGKHVITANKEVVAKHLQTFHQLAKDNHVSIHYEAAVGGGIPLISSLNVGLAANHITYFAGILNGTTNYILTQIEEKGLSFHDVLKTAQDLGFAEADPTMDVSGMDAAFKLIIIAANVFQIIVNIDDLYVEGIEGVSLNDIRHAADLGYRIKLLAQGSQQDNQISLSVRPTLVPLTHALASIRQETNALYTEGDMVGPTLLTGKGAGSLPTASAVLADLVTVSNEKEGGHVLTNFAPSDLVPHGQNASAFFIRLLAKDQSGILEKISGILGHHQVNISTIVQKEKINDHAEIVLTTAETLEETVRHAVQEMQSQGVVYKVESVLSILG